MLDNPEATATVKLDGQDIDLIISSLKREVTDLRKKNNFFRAKQIELIISNLASEKKAFHYQWLKHIEQRHKEQQKDKEKTH